MNQLGCSSDMKTSCADLCLSQVRFLEQQNKMLETKLELLQGQCAGRSNVEPLFEVYMAGLRRQMDLVNNDKSKLDGELRNMQGLVEDYKHKSVRLVTTLKRSTGMTAHLLLMLRLFLLPLTNDSLFWLASESSFSLRLQ